MRAVCAREAALLGESLVQLLSACFSGKKRFRLPVAPLIGVADKGGFVM